MKNADMPAMPVELNGFGQYAPEVFTGLTKREEFAKAAMQGVIHAKWSTGTNHQYLAREAVEMADALLAELEKQL